MTESHGQKITGQKVTIDIFRQIGQKVMI